MADRPRQHSVPWFLDSLAWEGEVFARTVAQGDLDAEVAACPGWTLSGLVEHLGQIHRWAAFCARHGRAPDRDEAAALETFDVDRAADWYRECLAELLGVLVDLDPEAATWHPFPGPRVAAFWPRRQAHETAMHRWDAQHAIGMPDPIDPDLAADAVDEYVEVVVPRRLARDGLDVPAGTLHLHCTDAAGEWLVWGEHGQYRMVRDHARGDAVLRGPAEAILLACWGRADTAGLDIFGDEAVLAGWFGLSGI